MAAVVLICVGLFGLSGPDPAEYPAAAARAGRDAGARLKLAVGARRRHGSRGA